MSLPLFLLISLNEFDVLFDGVDGSTRLTNRNDRRLLEVFLGQTFDGRGHGSREQSGNSVSSLLHHRLTIDIHLLSLVLAFHSFTRQLIQNEGEVGFETEVDHSVCLIHDDVSTLRENDHVSFNHVLQTTRRRDDDFCTCAEVELLFLDGTLLKYGVSSPCGTCRCLYRNSPLRR